MKTWNGVLKRQIKRAGGIMPFFIQKCICSKVYHSLIMKYATKFKNPKLLEAGCGTAADSIYLSFLLNNIEAIDIDNQIVTFAKYMNKYLHGKVKKIYKQDIFSIKRNYDIIFNGGTYEHFSKDAIEKVLRLHLSKSKYLIFGIPTSMKNDFEPFGNELLMPIKEWRNIIKRAGGKVLEVYGIDHSFRPFRIATYNLVLSKLLSRFGNYKILVVSSNQK